MAQIAPSILAADFSRVAEALDVIRSAGASMVHVDVMDGHFTPEISLGQPVIASLRKATDLILDVHLLIERPERFVAQFVKAGANKLAVHPEASTQLHHLLELIRSCGAKVGLALNPATPLESVADLVGDLDFLTILCADPAVKEQAFIPQSITKVRAAARLRAERQADLSLQVEGGIDLDNLEELIRAGADILVAGFAIFSYHSPEARLAEMVRRAGAMREIPIS